MLSTPNPIQALSTTAASASSDTDHSRCAVTEPRAQSAQCPLPELSAGSFSGHLCRPALSLPKLSWRGPRELPENILSGVMFNLDSSPTPSRGSCCQKGHPQSSCPTSVQSSQLDPCKFNLGLFFTPKSVGEVANAASPVHRSRWVRRPEVNLRPILQSSHRRERGLETHTTHRA